MRIALVASPFISVPPSHYGGTELFIAQLAEGLASKGCEVIVYANGESRLNTEVRWLYERGEWPINGELYANLKDINHNAWAIRDAWDEADIIHLNNVPGLAFSRFDGPKFVYTIHHPYKRELSDFYAHYPQVQYVTISDFQLKRESMPRLHTIHHGVDTSAYQLRDSKQEYLCFLGRIAPLKGTHTAIEVAQRCGIPLKIAGEVQPMFRDYFESKIKPRIDGKFIEYVGTADLKTKNELLGNAMAMLFPIQWEEPFGLVMIEAMATGTPVVAFPGGAVSEIVRDGVSGSVCRSLDEMVECVSRIQGKFSPAALRGYVEDYFSTNRMVSSYAALYQEILAGSAKKLPKGALQPALLGTDKALLGMTEESAYNTEDPEEPRAVA
jgi:glycosyltransferase involved in cell wall biosynthesis